MIIRTNGHPVFVDVKCITKVYTTTENGDELHVYITTGENSYISVYMTKDAYTKILSEVQALKEKQIETNNKN